MPIKRTIHLAAILACGLALQCGPRTPYGVTQEEADQVLQLSPEKQIDAYLQRLLKTKPPNRELALIIAPNIDVHKHLEPRIASAKDGLLISDLIFLALMVCEKQDVCSKDRQFIDLLRKSCSKIEFPESRKFSCREVDEIENPGTRNPPK